MTKASALSIHAARIGIALCVALAADHVAAQDLTLSTNVTGQTLSFLGTMAPANQPFVNGTLQPVVTTTNFTQDVSSISNGTGAQLISDGPRTRLAQATGYAAAVPGSAHALVNAVAFDAVPSVNDPDGVPYLPDVYSMVASVTAVSQFIEEVTLTSSTLAVGTPVTFTYHLYAHGTVRGGGQGAQDTINIFFPDVLTGLPGGAHCTSFVCSGDDVMSAKVGDILTFGATIVLATSMTIDSAVLAARGEFWTDSSSGDITVDASNTAGEWVSDFTPGLTFTGSTGFDYTLNPAEVTAVPEPSTAGMLFAGLGLMVAWARRRNAAFQAARL